MTREDLLWMMHRAVDGAYGQHPNSDGEWPGDCAMKIYFYPLCSALLEDGQFEEVCPDDIIIAPEKYRWVALKLGVELDTLAKQVAVFRGLVGEFYLSVVVYGVHVLDEEDNRDDLTWVFNIVGDGKPTLSIMTNVGELVALPGEMVEEVAK